MKYIKNIMKGVSNMKLVVGLGNPTEEYNNTRHNIGYMFLDYVTNGEEFKVNKKFNAMEYITMLGGEKIIFVKPLTFMNLSGEAVIKYVNFYKLKPEDILVIQDDLDLDVGRYKLMFNHGDGGHNGIKNIILNLSSRNFLRLKIGISKAKNNTRDYVLGKFSKSELTKIKENFSELDNFMEDYVSMSRDLLMGKYNSLGKIDDKQEG